MLIAQSKYSNLHFQLMKNYTWEQYEDYIKGLVQNKDFWIFRGHSNESWELSTSIQRSYIEPKNRLKFEEKVIDQLKRRMHFYLPNELFPANVVEWLALMQHYGACTRLLDWTKSPYIAAFFAMIDCNENDSCVWALNMSKLIQILIEKYPDLFQRIIVEDIKKRNTEIIDGMEIAINMEDERILVQFSEKCFNMVFPVYPYKLNERMNNQQGIFITQGSIEEKFENCIANVDYDNTGLLLRKICISKNEKRKILRILSNMNINYATLFPGIEGIIKSINTKCIEDFI